LTIWKGVRQEKIRNVKEGVEGEVTTLRKKMQLPKIGDWGTNWTLMNRTKCHEEGRHENKTLQRSKRVKGGKLYKPKKRKVIEEREKGRRTWGCGGKTGYKVQHESEAPDKEKYQKWRGSSTK